MYTVTADHIHLLYVDNQEIAKRLADNIKGAVYLFLFNVPVCIYSYLDSQ